MASRRRPTERPDRHGRQGVSNVVNAGHAERYPSQRLAVVDDGERRTVRGGLHIARQEAGIDGLGPVANDVRGRRRWQRVGADIVGAQDHRARRLNELLERPADIGQVRVDVQVIGLDVGYHGHRRPESEKRAVVLVGLDNIRRGPAGPQVAAPIGHAPTDQGRRIDARRRQCFGRHHRRRGLPVSAGDRDQRRHRSPLRPEPRPVVSPGGPPPAPARTPDDRPASPTSRRPRARRRRATGRGRARPRCRGARDRRFASPAASQPVTTAPRRTHNSARPLIPAPAIPTKCTGRWSAGSMRGMRGRGRI